MNRVHDAAKPDADGLQRCKRCGYILASGRPYWKTGFVSVTAKIQNEGANDRLELCGAPKG